MDENINKHLHDILNAINEIESFFGDKPKYFNEFCNDLCLRRAVERDIEIIGEAMNRILKENRNIAITNSRKIVDARNYIIHGYDSLSADILWSIVINHLPKLKEEAQTYSYQPPAETERGSADITGTIDILNDTPSCSNVRVFYPDASPSRVSFSVMRTFF